jgi:hypothetical protein
MLPSTALGEGELILSIYGGWVWAIVLHGRDAPVNVPSAQATSMTGGDEKNARRDNCSRSENDDIEEYPIRHYVPHVER